jgi:hypothetical protein
MQHHAAPPASAANRLQTTIINVATCPKRNRINSDDVNRGLCFPNAWPLHNPPRCSAVPDEVFMDGSFKLIFSQLFLARQRRRLRPSSTSVRVVSAVVEIRKPSSLAHTFGGMHPSRIHQRSPFDSRTKRVQLRYKRSIVRQVGGVTLLRRRRRRLCPIRCSCCCPLDIPDPMPVSLALGDMSPSVAATSAEAIKSCDLVELMAIESRLRRRRHHRCCCCCNARSRGSVECEGNDLKPK